MGGRYFLTGVQIGMMKAYLTMIRELESNPIFAKTLKAITDLLEGIEENQYVCSSSDPLWIALKEKLGVDR